MPPIDQRGVSSDHEIPQFIPFREGHMFGVLTTPRGPARRTGVVLANGAGVVPCCGRNQFWTTLARRLAAQGFHSLRFDYPGAGDSPGLMGEPDFRNPLADEVAAAHEWLLGHGVDDAVIIGKCFGGRNAVYAAAGLRGVRGVAMISTPVMPEMKAANKVRNTSLRELAGRALSPERLRRYLGAKRKTYARMAAHRLSVAARQATSKLPGTSTAAGSPASRFFARLDPLLESGTHVLIFSGTDDAYFTDLQHELEAGHLATQIEAHGDRIRVELIEGRVHGFGRIQLQEDIRDTLVAWLLDITPEPGADAWTSD